MADSYGRVFTIGVGGAAGDGVREAGLNIGSLLAQLGYEVFVSFSYPSLIRGGHNFMRVSFSTEKLWSDHEKLDVLIALNDETVDLHRAELHPDAVVINDPPAGGVPMLSAAESLNAPAITRSSVALGALCYLWDLPLEQMFAVLRAIFPENKFTAANIQLAGIGYEHLRAANFRHTKKLDSSLPPGLRGTRELVDGNTALARGLMAAGLDFYFAYPMTPATSILHFLAKQVAVKTIQPENELAVINMALGAVYAGKRAAIGSASGGFALMQEAFSFAGGAELPLVVAVSQRQAPATGVPTYSNQTDLRFVLHAGHGEFPRLVIAPGDAEETFQIGALALNLAWKYQLPAIVLLDKIVSEHSQTVNLDAGQIKTERGERIVPGTPGQVVKVTSYEHDENGISTEDPAAVKSAIDKRFAKVAALRQELSGQETVKVYGDASSDIAIVFWGSTKGPVLEAAKYLTKPVKLVQILWLEPFDVERVRKELSSAKKIIDIEANHDGQLASLVYERTGIKATDFILRYDSRPFSGADLTEKINALLN